jgi:hypothetical protein
MSYTKVCTDANNRGIASHPISALYGSKGEENFLRDMTAVKTAPTRPTVAKSDPRISLRGVPFALSKGILVNLQPGNTNVFPVEAIRDKGAKAKLDRLVSGKPEPKPAKTGKGKPVAKGKGKPVAAVVAKKPAKRTK